MIRHALSLSATMRAKGTTPADARLLLTTATDSAYTVQAEVGVVPGSTGGRILFYSENAFVGITFDGHDFTVHEDARRRTRHDPFAGNRWFVRIVNADKPGALLASRDGQVWETVRSGIDVSQLHHNRFNGFVALRPGLMAAGAGEVRFNAFLMQLRRLPSLLGPFAHLPLPTGWVSAQAKRRGRPGQGSPANYSPFASLSK